MGRMKPYWYQGWKLDDFLGRFEPCIGGTWIPWEILMDLES